MALVQSQKPFRREIELDFLRGIAILLVIDFHDFKYGVLTWLLTPLHIPNPGWMGVDIFFVLSGFLVGGLLVKEWKVKGRIDSRRFLIRRGFKIWPQYYVFILIGILSGHRTLHDSWGNILNIQNYVGGVAHTWSLAVEEHAYLFLVLILALAARRKARMRSLFLFLAGTCLCAELQRAFMAWKKIPIFEATTTRIDAILFGVMLAILYHYKPVTFHRMQRWVWLWIAIPLAALFYASFHFHEWWDVPVSLQLADFSGVALLMLLYRHWEGKKHSWLYRAIAWVGLYSYGIYLWHVAAAAPVVSLSHRLPTWMVPLWNRSAPAVIGILLGVVATKLVEFPTLRLRDRWFPRRVDSAVGTPAEFEADQPDTQVATAP